MQRVSQGFTEGKQGVVANSIANEIVYREIRMIVWTRWRGESKQERSKTTLVNLEQS